MGKNGLKGAHDRFEINRRHGVGVHPLAHHASFLETVFRQIEKFTGEKIGHP
jgi:hypothetical protein